MFASQNERFLRERLRGCPDLPGRFHLGRRRVWSRPVDALRRSRFTGYRRDRQCFAVCVAGRLPGGRGQACPQLGRRCDEGSLPVRHDFVFVADGDSEKSTVDGKYYVKKPDFSFKSPFVNGTWGGDRVRIPFAGEEMHLNFR